MPARDVTGSALCAAPIDWRHDPLVGVAVLLLFAVATTAVLLAILHHGAAAIMLISVLVAQLLLLGWAEQRRRFLLTMVWQIASQHRRDLNHEYGNGIVRIGIHLHKLRETWPGDVTAMVGGQISPAAQLSAVEDARDALDRSIDGVSRLLDIDISRATGRRPAMFASVLDLSDSAEDNASEFAPQANEKQISVEHACESSLILADPSFLLGIMTNLIGNAVKYTPRGGRIAISCFPAGKHAYLRIENSGPGIPPEKRQKIFQSGYRLRATRSERGTGFGLELVQRYVREMNGSIEAREASFGGPTEIGACFEVRFPLVEDDDD